MLCKRIIWRPRWLSSSQSCFRCSHTCTLGELLSYISSILKWLCLFFSFVLHERHGWSLNLRSQRADTLKFSRYFLSLTLNLLRVDLLSQILLEGLIIILCVKHLCVFTLSFERVVLSWIRWLVLHLWVHRPRNSKTFSWFLNNDGSWLFKLISTLLASSWIFSRYGLFWCW